MVEVLTCPACGFDPYDMIFYAIKQEFPDNNPRDVIEEMYKSGEYKDEADFYIFENHIDYCPNQDKLMKISAGFDTEDEAFNYAYNEGHAASRKNAPYKPNPSGKTGADFKKIYKQRAESTESKCSWWSGCDEEDEEITDCPECGSDFCSEHMCSDCDNCEEDCTCKCFECGENDRYDLILNTGQRTCMDCSERCDECEDRFPNDEVRSNNINNKSYCDECRSEKGECYICDEILLNYYNDNGSCEVCDESVCSECSKETEDPKNPGYVQHDVACDNCVKDKKLVVTAESFEAEKCICKNYTPDFNRQKPMTTDDEEEQAIIVPITCDDCGRKGETVYLYGYNEYDDSNLQWFGAEASDSYDNLAHQEDMALEAYEEYVQELDPATDYPPMSFEDWYEQTMAIYDTPEYDKYLEQQYLKMQENEEELERQLKTLEADWRDLPRDSAGRWTRITPEEPETIDAYIDIQPAQSGNFPLPDKEQETFSQSQVTLRELSEMMNTLTGNLLGFDMAYRTVIDMLGSKDTPERREALLSTMEETIMTLEFYEETGYDGDIQMMVDIMRQNGMAPPPQFEEEVMARYQFEDKYAAEDKKILKPEVPADYNLQQTFGNNMVLMAEGLEEDRNSPAFEKWEEKFYLCYHDWQDDELHVDTFDEKYQITAYCSLCDATMLLTNLHIGDNGPDVIELPGRRPLLDFYDTSQEAYAAEEDEGPTIEDFFRDISKVLNKYGEFSWDSEAGEEGLYFSGMLLPHNGAENFFQYDEDFSE